MPYIGNSPKNNVRDRFYYTATSGQTLFSGSDLNGKTLAYQDGRYVDVYLNGVILQDTTDYTATTKTSITLISGATTGDLVEIVAYGIFSVSDTVSAASGGDFAGEVQFSGGIGGDVSFDTNTLKVDATNNRVGVGTSPLAKLHVDNTNSAFYMGYGGNEDIYLQTTNGNVLFTNKGATTERMRILAGGGITFNGDTAAANALDDYEEGTWTPSVRGSTTNGSFSGSNTVGFYTKIGDTVHAWFDCDGTISGAAGIILFTGLPYTSNAAVEAIGQFMFNDLNVDGTRNSFVLYLGGTSTEMSIFESKDDTSWSQTSISNEAIGIRAQITYKV